MKRPLSFWLIFAMACLNGSRVGASVETTEISAWNSAQTAYDAGRFQEALDAYQEVRRQGTSSALDYNIGNALMRLGQPDRAIAHYRRAQWLSPGDPDLQANLDRAVDRTDALVPSLPPLRRLTAFLDATQWQWSFVACCWLLASAGLARRWSRALRDASAWMLPALAILVLLAGIGVYGSLPGPMLSEAVLQGDTVNARFEPLEDATKHFSLPGGSVVKVLERTRTWMRIEADGKTGWVPEDQLLPLASL